MTEWDQPSLRKQLARMAQSRAFARADRMFPLLAYLVDARIRGMARSLDQRRIAIDVFGRDNDFDPACDAIVRVEIGRLRNKLREYYASEGGADELVVDVPRGQYRARIRPRTVKPYRYPQSLPPQQVRYAKTPDGISLAYSAIGEGYPLVMLPHWLSHIEADLKNPLFRHYWLEFGRRFRLVRYDIRGFGLSDRDVPDFPFDALVTDLETVVDALGLEKFALFGPSGGAAIGAAYAARHPKRVSHLVLLGGFIRGPRRSGDPARVDYADAMEALIQHGWGQPQSRFRNVFCSVLVPDATAEQYRWMDDAQLAASSGENAQRYYKLLCEFDLSDEVANIRAPTLLAHGTEEAIPVAEARHAAACIPGARLLLLPTKNHALMPEEPAWAQFLRELDDFFSNAGSGGRRFEALSSNVQARVAQ
jgi:pimeloyl-ACP methyl ester carboxylesterase